MDVAPAPRVSIVVSAFNAERFIAATIASALNQTFADFELLVIDDGSTDGTAGAVRRALGTDPRCRLIVQRNGGPSSARNRGVAESSGGLIAFLDHDDLWHPEKLAAQVELLDAMPDAGVATCYSAVIDASGRCLGWRLGGEARGRAGRDMIEWDMVSGGSVAMVRRTALAAAGAFDESLRFREDWDMWIRLARHVPFVTVPRILVGYTRRPRSASSDYERMAAEGALVLAKACSGDPGIGAGRLRHCTARDLFGVSCFCAMDAQNALAWQYLARSWAISPWPLLLSPRRWAFVAILALQSVLPRAAFRYVFRLTSRAAFGLRAGDRFPEALQTGS